MITQRQRRLAAQKSLKKDSNKFELCDLSTASYVPNWMTRAYRNNLYTVMINDNCKTTHGTCIRAMIQKHTDTPFINHWATIQQIKNEIFGKETIAVEYYPKESDLINDHNIYWIFIYPDGLLPKPL